MKSARRMNLLAKRIRKPALVVLCMGAVSVAPGAVNPTHDDGLRAPARHAVSADSAKTPLAPDWQGQGLDRFREAAVSGAKPVGPAVFGDSPAAARGVQPDLKWQQLPDLDPTSMVVFTQWPPATNTGVVAANDFLCTTTGPITEIHVWGGWYFDALPGGDPTNLTFVLSIHDDAGGLPGGLQWLRTFVPGEFIAQPYADVSEGFYDPSGDYYEPAADFMIWEYVFYVPAGEQFTQQGTAGNPVTYWLDVQARPEMPSYFGWKTTTLADQWNSMSFWAEGMEPAAGPWARLFYPWGHDWVGDPLDLAFAIYGVEDVCEPDATGTACKQAGCPAGEEDCTAKCMNYNPVTGVSTVITCECDASTDCHAEATPPPPNRCVQPDNGTGTVTLPPIGCDYVGPNEVHEIIDGLPPGTTIELDPIHMDFICTGVASGICSLALAPGTCEMQGGSLGGHGDCFESTLDLTVRGTGGLAGFNRHLAVPIGCEVHTGPRNPGDPVQSFATDMYRLQGELFGDPDFCTFRVTGGTDFGLPSPGQTTLTDIGGGLYDIDSFFDVAYTIEFEGCPGSQLDGYAGTTMATIRMETGGTQPPPTCIGDCPFGTVCEQSEFVNPDGTVDYCCDCVSAPCEPTPDGSQCQPAQECTDLSETCDPHCVQFDSATGETTMTDCDCFGAADCHVVPPPPTGQDNPCIVDDNGTGTATLPPAGCEYLSPAEVHEIINGLPPGTTIELDASHRDFFNVTTSPGGSLGGEIERFDSTLALDVSGTGLLAGFNRTLWVPIDSEVHTGPRNPGDPVQSFPNDMFRLQGELFGDPDFCTFRVTGGTDFGLPSPGQTTLTDLGDGTWHIDSFFDVSYLIDFEGCPGSQLDGYMGETMATLRMATGNALPTCAGGCDQGYVCQQTVAGNGSGVIDVCCDCVPDVCEPTPDGSGCTSLGCPAVAEDCKPRCMDYDPQTQATSVSVCDCGGLGDCHPVPTPPITDPCVVADNGTGTITLPPAGCEYLSPSEVHTIIDGLPPGTTIELDPIHLDFICGQSSFYCSLALLAGECEAPGGSLGGHADCFDSTLDLTVSGTGGLAGFHRHLAVPVFTEVHTGPRNPGDPVQGFATDMYRLIGELFGDPDFCTFRVMGGTDFGLPSPGHTTLTDLGNGTFNVDSFFDVAYQIDFEGCPGSQLDGYAGTTMATIRMKTGGSLAPPSCVGDCPPGTVCVQDITQNPDGTVEVCCNCVVALNPPLEAPAPHDMRKNRYISYDPNNAGNTVAFELVMTNCSDVMWVDAPQLKPDGSYVARVAIAPVYRNWTEGVVHVSDEVIGPGTTYRLRATTDGVVFSDALYVATVDRPTPHAWADLVDDFDSTAGSWSAPQGITDFLDIMAVVRAFQTVSTAPHNTRADLSGIVTDYVVNFMDIAAAISGFLGDPYPPASWTLTTGCRCDVNGWCDDGLFCNGVEFCVNGWCQSGADPCPGRLCDEATGSCVDCVGDADCDDGFFCNGTERCTGGLCHPGSYPCGSDGCDEAAASCDTVSNGPELALFPIEATGDHAVSGNEITLYGGGQEVRVDLFVSGWDFNQDGVPRLGLFQGTLDGSSHLGETATPPNVGVDLNPLGWPGNPELGLFQIARRCLTTGEPCDCDGQPCVPAANCPVVCAPNADFVMDANDATWSHSRPTLDYAWGAGVMFGPGITDPGSIRYGGTLLIDVPAGAMGTYHIHLDPNPDLTFLTDPQFTPLADLVLRPGLIRVIPPPPLDPGTPHNIEKNRYVSFDPNNSGTVAYEVALPDGRTGWVDTPQLTDWSGTDPAYVSLVVGAPVYRVWSEPVVHVTGCVVAPDEVYPIRATPDGVAFSDPYVVGTVPAPPPSPAGSGSWADIVGSYTGSGWSPPNGFVNFNDIDAAVKKFQVNPTAPHVTVVDLEPQWPTYVVNFSDIGMVIKGFQSVPYPVPAADCQTIANCPLGGSAPCVP